MRWHRTIIAQRILVPLYGVKTVPPTNDSAVRAIKEFSAMTYGIANWRVRNSNRQGVCNLFAERVCCDAPSAPSVACDLYLLHQVRSQALILVQEWGNAFQTDRSLAYAETYGR